MTMPIICATKEEAVYSFLTRALQKVNASKWNCMKARHNDVEILVYQGSLLGDICDKFAMQNIINQLQREYIL